MNKLILSTNKLILSWVEKACTYIAKTTDTDPYHKARSLYAMRFAIQKYDAGQIEARDLERSDLRALFLGKMTYFYRSEGEAMAPTIQGPEHTLLVRKLALPSKLGVSVGDVLVFKDPSASNKLLVRRLSALEGEAIVSPKKKNKLSVLGKGKCWVVADNKDLTAKKARDSRTFGPISINDVVGRVAYIMRTPQDHGLIANSLDSMSEDSAVVSTELDLEELVKRHKSYQERKASGSLLS